MLVVKYRVSEVTQVCLAYDYNNDGKIIVNYNEL